MLLMPQKMARVGLCAFLGTAFVFGAQDADAKKKAPKDYSPLVFDAQKRKKTKHVIAHNVSYSAYASLRFLGEQNLLLDDGQRDTSQEAAAYLGLIARAKLSDRVLAFAHLEADLRKKTTHAKSYAAVKRLNVKEALVSYKTSQSSAVTIGRMRFSDAHKWVMDAAVDGVHFAKKSANSAFEVALVRDQVLDGGTYALFHTTRFKGKNHMGFYALAEQTASEKRVHLVGYLHRAGSATLSYTLHGAGVFGDAAQGKSSGFGFDARATYKLNGASDPQVTFGLAAGSTGFTQSGLHSNKTYDGGQTQFHRYGYVFQPELNNLAVATVGLGLRPSKRFSVDLSAHLYGQIKASTVAPIARVQGSTTGVSRFVGAEMSLKGAWRPSKKTKVEFGIGAFKAGSAYANRSTSKRVYARFSMYF